MCTAADTRGPPPPYEHLVVDLPSISVASSSQHRGAEATNMAAFTTDAAAAAAPGKMITFGHCKIRGICVGFIVLKLSRITGLISL